MNGTKDHCEQLKYASISTSFKCWSTISLYCYGNTLRLCTTIYLHTLIYLFNQKDIVLERNEIIRKAKLKTISTVCLLFDFAENGSKQKMPVIFVVGMKKTTLFVVLICYCCRLSFAQIIIQLIYCYRNLSCLECDEEPVYYTGH